MTTPKFEKSPDGIIFTFDSVGFPIRVDEDSSQYLAWKLVNGDAPLNPELEIWE
jgi:hypothetical protein